mmetsp:Transcript_107328/g.189801  ORF Transcript_107328/g.189801 Transcript_107328/m.189801 type:complete len:85 (+) Transcript_107328:1109-1363(+)
MQFFRIPTLLALREQSRPLSHQAQSCKNSIYGLAYKSWPVSHVVPIVICTLQLKFDARRLCNDLTCMPACVLFAEFERGHTCLF